MRRRFPTLVLALAALIASTSLAGAQTNLVIRESKLGVKETIDALVKALEAKGVKVVARVDHAAGAKSVNMDLPPTELVIFGNPALGTPLMQSNRQIAIELPMKVIAWQDAGGKVQVAYTDPEALKARYGIKDRDSTFKAMAAALDAFTTAAISK